MVTILLFIAPEGFRENEYFEIKKILEENNFNVLTVSTGVEKAKGRDVERVKVDHDLYDLEMNEFDGIILLGGPGMYRFQKDLDFHYILRKINNHKKLIGAICISPTILAYAGILSGKCATVWNGDDEQFPIFQKHDVQFINSNRLIIDENIFTICNPESCSKFLTDGIISYFN